MFLVMLLLMISCSETRENNKIIAIAIHGGAGNISTEMPDSLQEEYHLALDSALEAGYFILKNGGTSLDAVTSSVVFLENHPLFNAGKGAVITKKGTIEHDASIMDGNTMNAGAVAGTRHVKNPILLAREVMADGESVLLAGRGAEEFALAHGFDLVDTSYFYTPQKSGTVGCVAIDKEGNLCAGTSTGGRMNKEHGRIGDSPIIGAGTYAENSSCAVSCTGHGEFFIRYCVAYDISALMNYENLSLNEAADLVILDKLTNAGGTGGVISLDKNGNIAFSFNTTAMFRGYINKEGIKKTMIFK